MATITITFTDYEDGTGARIGVDPPLKPRQVSESGSTAEQLALVAALAAQEVARESGCSIKYLGRPTTTTVQ